MERSLSSVDFEGVYRILEIFCDDDKLFDFSGDILESLAVGFLVSSGSCVGLLDEGLAIDPLRCPVVSPSSKPCRKIGVKIEEGVRAKRSSPYPKRTEALQ
ncbi:hypothetical protein TNCV_339221 [Trichonephila clavipes]|nr:hypothetical protein TNCV_339221 [Trichonephila clavipes]